MTQTYGEVTSFALVSIIIFAHKKEVKRVNLSMCADTHNLISGVVNTPAGNGMTSHGM